MGILSVSPLIIAILQHLEFARLTSQSREPVLCIFAFNKELSRLEIVDQQAIVLSTKY